ncbi:ketopantoate reductase family protein [Natronincola peptidivorans]|nr:2-dehydropantoate 2-reductase [Natronincola peptidivorans]
MILGTGGTGGCIGGYLAASGKDVTFIARGQHLKAMKENGLLIHSSLRGKIHLKKVKAFDSQETLEKYDVIFVCVKGYSLHEIVPLIAKTSHKKTVVIPILNTLNASEKLQKALPGINVLDGCIYVSAFISTPGEITQGIKIFRVVFGPKEDTDIDNNLLLQIQEDLLESGIEGILSNNMRRDIFKKFAFTSACAATGAYYDVKAGEMQKEGKYNNTFLALLKELQLIANALNIQLDCDLIEESLQILAGLASDTTSSLQKDMKLGGNNEKSELIFDIVRIAEKYGVDVPYYQKIAMHFGYKN